MHVPYDKGAQILGDWSLGRLNFDWCVFCMRLASCYASGTYGLEVPCRFLENLCILAVCTLPLFIYCDLLRFTVPTHALASSHTKIT